MMKNKFLILFLLGIFAFTSSCAKRKTKKKAEENEIEITQYLEDNSISAIETGTGLYYVIDSTTTGDRPVAGSTVTVGYKGYFLDGEVFDQSPTIGTTFSLSGVIRGWQEGIPFFPEGSKGRLFIPAHLGYGLSDQNGIPGGSVLVFDIDLKDI